MAPQPKGKQGTKGAKQIVEENAATLKFYRNMAAGGSVIYLLVTFLLFEFTGLTITMTIISIAALLAAYQFMAFMAKTTLSDTGSILDSGNDLNIEGGIAENVKDLIILTTGTQLLSLTSNWFWLLFTLAPARAVWMLWRSVIQPWLSQKSDEQPDVDDKKQKKLERKMKQRQMR
ncbi:hypothetical protein HA402_001993 [Bradysia odoriphaga]|nr:hypothetical protein HA402_001993 [Bradysia odoriphaga]